ncbi:MAG: hypothetical protein ACP5GU_01310 [Thermoprotei archaeon]
MNNLNVEGGVCDKCGGKIIKTPEGEFVCSECGLVKGHEFAEPNYTIAPMKSDHVGYVSHVYADNMSLIYGVGSNISRRSTKKNFNKSSMGTLITHDKKIKLEKTKQIIEKRILNSMEFVASRLNIPDDVLRRSIIIYAKTIRIMKKDKKRIPGVNKYALSAASLIAAIWEAGNIKPFTLVEIASFYRELGHRVDSRNIAWALIQTRKIIQRNITIKERIRVYIDRITAMLYSNTFIRIKIRYMRNKINLSTYVQKIKERALKILDSLDQNVYQSKNPYIIAASLVYISEKMLASELKFRSLLSHKVLSITIGISDYSIRDNVQAILSYLGIKIDLSSRGIIRSAYPNVS